ncbi:MAG: hypothetical protein AB7T37_07180 [Dehalococcoidia bacterium]
MPRSTFFMAMASVAFAVAAAFVITGDGQRAHAAPLPAQVTPGAVTELELAQRFAPVYYLKEQRGPCDAGGDPFNPSPVEVAVGGDPGIRLRDTPGGDVAGPTAPDLRDVDAPAFLDFPGDPRRPGCRYERDFQRLSQGIDPAVYARITREPGRDGFAIQYWAYYYFNDWNNTHESDWEMVSLVFESATLEDAWRDGPAFAAYAAHGAGERQDWDSKRIEKDDGHPVIYVSSGSHASYFQPSVYLGLGEEGSGFGCDIADGPHRRVTPAVILLREPGSSAEPTPWLTFGGRWGERLGGEFNGPTGPQTKRAWQDPITWAEDQRAGTATLPGSDLLGNNNVRSFCTLVAEGSRLLRVFFEFPAIVGGALVLVLGTVGAAGFVVARDAFSDPLVGPARGGFLRKRRTLGQVLRAATVLYWRQPRLFLAFSVLFIPVELVFSLLHHWLVSVPPFENILWLFNANEVSRLAMALLLGGAASFVVYLGVLTASLTAIAALDAGQVVTPRSAYRDAIGYLPRVLAARGRALLAVAVLGLSVAGIPLAAWLAVRWQFVEAAAVLDDNPGLTASAASGRAVAGRFRRSLIYVFFFGIFGAVSGPALAVVLLLGTGLDAGLINVLSGLFHAVVMPFTAIGLALAYCDLERRAGDDELTREPERIVRARSRLRQSVAIAGNVGRRALGMWEGRGP